MRHGYSQSEGQTLKESVQGTNDAENNSTGIW